MIALYKLYLFAGSSDSHVAMSKSTRTGVGYTSGMKTAVSIPDETFRAGERLAKRLKKSRSRLYADALREYVARHDPATITASINEAIRKYGQPVDEAWLQAGLDTLRRIEW